MFQKVWSSTITWTKTIGKCPYHSERQWLYAMVFIHSEDTRSGCNVCIGGVLLKEYFWTASVFSQPRQVERYLTSKILKSKIIHSFSLHLFANRKHILVAFLIRTGKDLQLQIPVIKYLPFYDQSSHIKWSACLQPHHTSDG